jgi:hypothetical protein
MLARSFSDEEDESSEENGSGSTDGVEYTFEGFNVEFSEKVMLNSVEVKSKS